MMNLNKEFAKKEKAYHRIKEGDKVQFDGEKFEVISFDKEKTRVIISNGSIEMELPPQHIERHNGRFF
jgi:dsDNA-specific endonuclease/ATPase MutS2